MNGLGALLATAPGIGRALSPGIGVLSAQQRHHLADVCTGLQPLKDAEGPLGFAQVNSCLGRAIHKFGGNVVPCELSGGMPRRRVTLRGRFTRQW